MLVTALFILFALAALAVLARQLYREHASRGKEGADAAPVPRQPCRQRSGGSRAVGPDGGR